MSVGDQAEVSARYDDVDGLEFSMDGVEWRSESSVPARSGGIDPISGVATVIAEWEDDFVGRVDVDFGDLGTVTFIGGPPVCI